MLVKRHFLARLERSLKQVLRRNYSANIGVTGYENCDSDVEHTSIFSQAILDHLLPVIKRNSEMNEHTRCLDMTFGTGGHTSLILDHGLRLTEALTVVASDRDWLSFQAAQEMSTRYSDRLIPLQSRFSQLSSKLNEIKFRQQFDAIILHTGISNLQRNDSSRGFCPRKKGTLDLRMDDTTDAQKSPTASEVLQYIDEQPLQRILKRYGALKVKAKYVTTAVLEARYLFHQFKTNQELYDVLNTAAKNYCRDAKNVKESELEARRFMMEHTIQALRYFINDELNELDFAVRCVAEKLLKKETGLLFVIVENPVESKVLETCLTEVNFSKEPSLTWSDQHIESFGKSPWDVLPMSPLGLSQAEKVLHPRVQNSQLYIARRTSQTPMLPVATTTS